MAANLVQMHQKAIELLEKKLLFSKLGENGVCQVYDAQVDKNGYTKLCYRHPSDGKWTTVTSGRAVVMVKKEKTIFLDDKKEASHLCHNKTCVLPEHIVFEDHSINNQRKTCVREGRCIGHGPQHPECLVMYKMD